MNVVLVVILAVAGVLALVALAGFVVSRTMVRGNAEKARVTLRPAQPRDHEESAAMLAPDSSFGVLRLTADELQYADGSTGAIVAIDRTAIRAVGATEEHGSAGRSLRRPALAVSAGAGAWVFAVGDLDGWLRRLN